MKSLDLDELNNKTFILIQLKLRISRGMVLNIKSLKYLTSSHISLKIVKFIVINYLKFCFQKKLFKKDRILLILVFF